MTDWTFFDIHGLMSIAVARATPGEPQLRLMLAPFLVDDVGGEPTVTVTGRREVCLTPANAEIAYQYDRQGVYFPRLSVRREDSRWHVGGAGELLGVVLPLIDRICGDRGAAMVHAATMEIGGRGVCLASWGGVGKTSTVKHLMKRPDVRFMGDDWAFVSASGELLGWEKPLFLKAHHRALYPEVFASVRKPLVPPKLTRPLSAVATAVHPVIARHARLAAFTRRWSPEHHIVPPGLVFGTERISSAAPLAGLAFVERYEGHTAVCESIGQDDLTARVVGNFHAELPHQSRELITAFGATGLFSVADYFAGKAEILRKALHERPTGLIRIPASWPPPAAAEAIADLALSRLLSADPVD